ncbi:MAG: glycosyltransferase family 4 protein [Acidobacteriota bacterium]
MSPLKILRVITRLNIGGPAQHAVFLTSGLNGSDFESKLVTGKTDDHEGDMSFLAEKHGIQLIQIESLSNGSGPLADIKTFWHLYQIIKRERPDLADLHLLKARFIGGIAAKLARVPIIVETFHGHLFSEYYGQLKTAAILVAERFLGWVIVDKVIAISKNQKQDLIRHKICPERKVMVIPLGLDLSRFVQCSKFRGEVRRELGISKETILLGSVGRLVPIKGLFYLLEAVAKLKSFTRSDFQVLIVGDGILRKELEEKAAVLGLPDGVRFLGWRFDLEKIYADLDVVVLSSLNEGTPVSVIEAMAAGKAVVATRVGGVPDVVEDGVGGILVPPRNSNALARAIARLIENAELRATLGRQAKESVYPKYDVTRLVNDMMNLYLDLL